MSPGVETPVSTTTNSKQETEEQETAVVVAGALLQQLERFGIAKGCAAKLLRDYPVAYIREKVAMAEELVARGSALISQNPAGWLRRAIEEDYQPPRERQAFRRNHRFRHKTHKATTDPKQQQPGATQSSENEPEHAGSEHEAIGSTSSRQVWHTALTILKEQMPAPAFATWVKDTVLLGIGNGVARIKVSSTLAASWLERMLYWRIIRALSDVLPEREVTDVQFVTA
jgi:hypothetical protein